MYKTDTTYSFMNMETYEQVDLDESQIANEAKYLTYEVKYGSTSYTASASNLSTLLAKTNGRQTVTVTVTYTTPADSADLPQTAVNVNLSASLDYTQA